MIRCIVCDLDGTLIRKDDSIDKDTLCLLKECMSKGVEFIIATGRDINMVIDLMDRYDLDCDLILNNGAQYCRKDLSVNDIYPMDNDAFLRIAHILKDYGYLLAIHTNKGKYSFHDVEDFWDYHMKLLKKTHYSDGIPKKTFTTREGYLRDFHYVKNPEDIIDQGIKVLKIDARHLDVYSIEGVKEQLQIDHLDISSSYADNIEITSDKSNKGLLLKNVVKSKGYHYDEVAVFGDGENDKAMLEAFKYSFAPSNASKHALDSAHYKLVNDFEHGAVYEGLMLLKEMNEL